MIAETRGTEISVGFINDIYFYTLVQELMHGWLLEKYPDLKLGSFLYKTTSLHYFCNLSGPVWPQDFIQSAPPEPTMGCLSYNQYIKEMGLLYHYVDQYNKAAEADDIDKGIITTYGDLQEPDPSLFTSSYFYYWAKKLTHHVKHN
jgi:hypothetical protein